MGQPRDGSWLKHVQTLQVNGKCRFEELDEVCRLHTLRRKAAEGEEDVRQTLIR